MAKPDLTSFAIWEIEPVYPTGVTVKGGVDPPCLIVEIPWASIVPGDVLYVQYQANGGGWASPSDFGTYIVTAYDKANKSAGIYMRAPFLGAGTWDIRGRLQNAAATDVGNWSTVTGHIIDLTKPTVSTLSPAHGATGVSLGTTQISVTFDKDVMISANPKFYLYDASGPTLLQTWRRSDFLGGTPISPATQKASISGATVTLTLDSSFVAAKTYYARMGLGGTSETQTHICDLAGNDAASFGGASGWQWQT